MDNHKFINWKRRGNSSEQEENNIGEKRSKYLTGREDYINTSEESVINLEQKNLAEAYFYLNKTRLYFIEAFWKILPPDNLGHDFTYIQDFEAHQGLSCALILNFCYKSKSLRLGFRIGKGEDMEKELECERILDGSYDGLFDFSNERYLFKEESEKLLNIKENKNSSTLECTSGHKNINRNKIVKMSSIDKKKYNNKEHVGKSKENEKELLDLFDVHLRVYVTQSKHYFLTSSSVKPGGITIHKIPISENELNHINYVINNLSPKMLTILVEVKVNKQKLECKNQYIGLINEGMTCYMNSMLQTLNTIRYFKKAVFLTPSKKPSLLFALQKLFFEMSTNKSPVSNSYFKNSFGWGRDVGSQQQDVQEFNMILSNSLEQNMKGTELEEAFKYLFSGVASTIINCVHVNHKSIIDEDFMDIQLTVSGCRNLEESFDKYIEEEILEGENKYDAGKYFGKQIAKKGIKIKKFPNVLILQLKRFEYDLERNSMHKINDRFEFKEKIDLKLYAVYQDEDLVFCLHSVVVHSGKPEMGHYYAFIKSDDDSLWIKFNDESVTAAEEFEVFENNFGGDYFSYSQSSFGVFNKQMKTSESNAYILVYIKSSEKKKILCPIKSEEIPTNLISLIEKEKQEERRKKIFIERKEEYFDLKFFTKDSILYNERTIGILPAFYQNKENYIQFYLSTLSVPKLLTVNHFVSFLAKIFKLRQDNLLIFCFNFCSPKDVLKRCNYSVKLINKEEYYKSLYHFNNIYPLNFFFIYLKHDDCQEFFNINIFNKQLLKINSSMLNEVGKIKNDNEEIEQIEYVVKINKECNEESTYTLYLNIKQKWILNDAEYIDKSMINLTEYPLEKNEFSLFNESNFDFREENIIVIMKYLKLEFIDNIEELGDFSLKSSLVIGDILTMKKNQFLKDLKGKINYIERYKNFIDFRIYNKINLRSKVNFLVEFSCLNLNDSTLLHNFDKNFLSLNNDIITVFVDLIFVDNLLISKYLSVKSFSCIAESVMEQDQISIPLKIKLQSSSKISIEKNISLQISECELKDIIYSELVYKNLDIFFNNRNKKDSIVSSDEQLQTAKEYSRAYHQIIQLISPSLLRFNMSISSKLTKMNTMSFSYPILKYIQECTEYPYHSIEFKLNFLKDHAEKNKSFIISLFDVDNNCIVQLMLILPKVMTFSLNNIRAVLDERAILSKYYPDYKDLIFFIYFQNPITKIIYRYFSKNNDDIQLFEHKVSNFEYRLQPILRSVFQDLIKSQMNQDEGFLDFYICIFSKQNPFCDSFILSIDIFTTKVEELKYFIVQKLRKIKIVDDYIRGNFEKIKYFFISNFTEEYVDRGPCIGSEYDNKIISELHQGKEIVNILVDLPQQLSLSINKDNID
jgi:ubiquitin C-terminal hydrolase